MDAVDDQPFRRPVPGGFHSTSMIPTVLAISELLSFVPCGHATGHPETDDSPKPVNIPTPKPPFSVFTAAKRRKPCEACRWPRSAFGQSGANFHPELAALSHPRTAKRALHQLMDGVFTKKNPEGFHTWTWPITINIQQQPFTACGGYVETSWNPSDIPSRTQLLCTQKHSLEGTVVDDWSCDTRQGHV